MLRRKNKKSEARFECISLIVRRRKKKLRAEGFPFRDELLLVLAPLVAEFHPNARDRIYPPEVVTFCMLSAVLSRDDTLRAAVASNNADRIQQGKEPASLGTAAFSEARSKLAPEVLIGAARSIAERVGAKVPGGDMWKGMAPFVIDGTTLTASDTAENQRQFP